jgi:SAM-dependent methyltransferase
MRFPPMNLQSFAPNVASGPTHASLARSNLQYSRLAGKYDALTPRLEALRREAHALLRLRPGETVMDVGCGTGKSLAALANVVGASGRVIGLEPCAAMIDHARRRTAGCKNIELVETQVDALGDQVAAASVDAFLLMFTHDVLQSTVGMEALLRAAKPGARFALAGGKFFQGPLALLNPWVKWRQRPYCTTFANYDAPWQRLFAMPGLSATHAQDRYAGIAYVASASWHETLNAETKAAAGA